MSEVTSSSDVGLGRGGGTGRNEALYPSPNQVDAWQCRLGGELVIVSPRFAKLQAVPLRGGFFLDRQYFLDFQGNTSLNRGIAGGAGLVWSRLAIDFAYVHAFASRARAARVQDLPLGVVPGTDGAFGGFKQEGGKARPPRKFAPRTSSST